MNRNTTAIRAFEWAFDGPMWRGVVIALAAVFVLTALIVIPVIAYQHERGKQCVEMGATPVHIRGDGQFCETPDGTIFRIQEEKP